MKTTRRTITAAACAFATVTTLPAFAQSYPSRPIKLIVAYGPGSGADIMGRILAEKLSDRLKTSVVVENREGAGGALGTLTAAKSPADGYTLMLSPTTLTVSPHMQNPQQYDPLKDFAPIARVAILPMAVVAAPGAPYKTLRELLDFAKANPGKLNYATSGKGSPSHLEMELLRKRYGLTVTDIPYKNVGQAMTDVISGEVSFYFPTFPSALPHITSGRVRGLAIGATKRSEQAPTLPTLSEELALPDYEASVWYGLVAPAGTGADIIGKVASEVLQILELPEVRAQIARTGAQVSPMNTEKFASFLRSENTKWGGLVKELGLKDQ
jgi:tripartite-type tricarboxylate transporter receptor subunit TctC